MIAPTTDPRVIEANAARESRRWMAWKRCRCGECEKAGLRVAVRECIRCRSFQPSCRIEVDSINGGAVSWLCAGGCDER